MAPSVPTGSMQSGSSFATLFTRRPGLMGELRGKGAWEDIGALKAWLQDDLVGERNRYAREVVKDVEAKADIENLTSADRTSVV